MYSLIKRSILTIAALAMLIPAGLIGADGPKLVHVIDNDTIEVNTFDDVNIDKLQRQNFFNVYSSGGDDWKAIWRPTVIKPSIVITNNHHTIHNGDDANETENTAIKYKRVRGFRVQLANVLSEDQAKRIEERAKELFETVYVTFRSPNYRVRAGDFQRRSDADKAASEARGMGFRGAWVVPDRVNVPE